ncbi:MAG: response regulator [Rubripirellula sp.]
MKTKILFVDDEANVLSGLRRMLRGQRNEWEMEFANGGAAALELMESKSFDVVVSDMRMPGIDGAELLTRVSKLYPHTVRLVLSGQSEHEKIFRAIGPAHQFMSKPCDPEVLIQTIQRACGLQSQLHDEPLIRLISQIDSLPSLPEIYRDLVHELESDDASLDRVANMIGSDMGMTAKVLQLVNSSFFGLPQDVSCPKHAVSLLGLNVIRPLVLTADVFSMYEDPELDGFHLSESIEHCLAVATAARAIAEEETSDSHIINDSFIAGMMHDIGKLILSANLRETFAEATELAKNANISLAEAEEKVFGTSHAQVGAHLLGLWGLPNPIVEAVAFHHQPCHSGNDEFSALTAVHAANVIQQQRYPGDRTPVRPDWDLAYLEQIGLADRTEAWTLLTAPEPVA